MHSEMSAEWLAAARAGDEEAFARLVAPRRRELLVHCYRILGSIHDAEDVVQEAMLRAWRRLDTFAGRSTFRAWLYKIATNACLDLLDRQRARRMLPPATRPPGDPGQPFEPPLADPVWLEPLPDEWLGAAVDGPAARYAERESVTLAFLTALQLLPPRQRVVLLMRDVLGWHAAEVAEMLDMTAPAVNSALHRARAGLARQPGARVDPRPADPATRELLERYVRAWEAADVPGLLALFKEEVAFSMPPVPSWFSGRAAVGTVLAAVVFPGAPGQARAQWRLLPAAANAQPAFGVYQLAPEGDAFVPFGVQVLTVAEGGLAEVTTFLDPGLFPKFGLPARLEP